MEDQQHLEGPVKIRKTEDLRVALDKLLGLSKRELQSGRNVGGYDDARVAVKLFNALSGEYTEEFENRSNQIKAESQAEAWEEYVTGRTDSRIEMTYPVILEVKEGDYIQNVAEIISSAVGVARTIESEGSEGLPGTTQSLDNRTYKNIFGSFREQGAWRDEVKKSESTTRRQKIAVMCQGRLYELTVVDFASKVATTKDIEEQLDLIRLGGDEPLAENLGVITALPRGEQQKYWPAFREANPEAYQLMNEALFLVNLDLDTRVDDENEGSLGTVTSDEYSRDLVIKHNGFWGKGLTINIASSNQGTRTVLNFEHALVDGSVAMHVGELIAKGYQVNRGEVGEKFSGVVKKVDWRMNSKVAEGLKRGKEFLQKRKEEGAVKAIDIAGFGADHLKKMGLSPDCSLQILVQMTYYLMWREGVISNIPATVEPINTRSFGYDSESKKGGARIDLMYVQNEAMMRYMLSLENMLDFGNQSKQSKGYLRKRIADVNEALKNSRDESLAGKGTLSNIMSFTHEWLKARPHYRMVIESWGLVRSVKSPLFASIDFFGLISPKVGAMVDPGAVWSNGGVREGVEGFGTASSMIDPENEVDAGGYMIGKDRIHIQYLTRGQKAKERADDFEAYFNRALQIFQSIYE